MRAGWQVSFHCLKKNIFQRIAPEIEPPDAYLVFRCDAVDIAGLDPIHQNQLDAVGAYGTFTAQLFDRLGEITIRAVCLQFEEPLIGATFFVRSAWCPIRPSLRIRTASQVSSTSRSKCEHSKMCTCRPSRISRIMRSMRCRAEGSRPLVGSSSISSFGP